MRLERSNNSPPGAPPHPRCTDAEVGSIAILAVLGPTHPSPSALASSWGSPGLPGPKPWTRRWRRTASSAGGQSAPLGRSTADPIWPCRHRRAPPGRWRCTRSAGAAGSRRRNPAEPGELPQALRGATVPRLYSVGNDTLWGVVRLKKGTAWPPSARAERPVPTASGSTSSWTTCRPIRPRRSRPGAPRTTWSCASRRPIRPGPIPHGLTGLGGVFWLLRSEGPPTGRAPGSSWSWRDDSGGVPWQYRWCVWMPACVTQHPRGRPCPAGATTSERARLRSERQRRWGRPAVSPPAAQAA